MRFKSSLSHAALLAIAIASLLCVSAFGAASNSFVTGEALATQGVRVTLSGANVVTAGAADEDVGVTLAPALSGARVAVIMPYDGELADYTASGAITAGSDVYPAASGKVSANVAGKRMGKAVSASSVDGDSIRVLRLSPAADRIVIRHGFAAASVDDWIFVADRAYSVVSIKCIFAAAGTDAGAVTLDVRKVTAVGTDAPGAAASATVKEFLSAAFNLKATANVALTGALTATAADLNIVAGDKIGTNFIGTLTALAGGVVVVELKAR